MNTQQIERKIKASYARLRNFQKEALIERQETLSVMRSLRAVNERYIFVNFNTGMQLTGGNELNNFATTLGKAGLKLTDAIKLANTQEQQLNFDL